MPLQTYIFQENPYLSRLETLVKSSRRDEDGLYLILEDSIFFPAGGGQPSDHGSIDGMAVRELRHEAGEIRHYLIEETSSSLESGSASGTETDQGPTQFEKGATVHLELDFERRLDHMQQHSAQHLITAIALDTFGWKTTAFHLSQERSDIELDQARFSRRDLDRLEFMVNEAIRSGIPIRAEWIDASEMAARGVRSRGLPDGHSGPVRIVEIEKIDICNCGGTHLHSTAEMNMIKFDGTEPMRGGTRLYYRAGERLRTRFEILSQRHSEFKSMLKAPGDLLLSELERMQADHDRLKRENRRLQRLQNEAIANELITSSDKVGLWIAEDADMRDLQDIAKKLASKDQVALLAAPDKGTTAGPFIFVMPAGLESGLEDVIRGRIIESLDARGGGRGQLVQGKAGRIDQADQLQQELKNMLQTQSSSPVTDEKSNKP